MGQADFLLIIQACKFFRSALLLMSNTPFSKISQLPSGLSHNMIYGLWPQKGFTLLPKYSFT